jgi:hypothetical protein
MSGADDPDNRPEDLPDDLDRSGDGLITPEELVEHSDLDHDGEVTVEEFSEEHKQDRIDKELERIKKRRTDSGRRLIRGFEDIVLFSGVVYGAVFLVTMTILSSGVLGEDISDEVGPDHYLSTTFVDPGGECLDTSGLLWVGVWEDNSEMKIRMEVYTPSEWPHAMETKDFGYVLSNSEGMMVEAESFGNRTDGNLDFSYQFDGLYSLEVLFLNLTDYNLSANDNSTKNAPSFLDEPVHFELEIHTETSQLPWKKDEVVKQATIIDTGPRACWSLKQLGGWSWALMGAEWAGGRETAMLAGGSAEVPAWWMAYISLSMSVFFLFVQYPLMYRFYHRDTDDMLSDDQVKRLVRLALERSERKLNIVIDWDDFRMRKRDLSIDVLVPYETTLTTVIKGGQGSKSLIRDEMLKEVLAEFREFREITPLQLEAKPQGGSRGGLESLTEGRSDISLPEVSSERPALVEDYSSFFEDLNTLANVERVVQKALKDFCVLHRLVEKGIWVGVDEQHVLVRIIYKPKTRLAFFRFSESYIGVRSRVHEHLMLTVGGHIGDRELVVSASNQVHTLADRSAAGRIEQAKGGLEGQAFVAKQEGIAGTLLQTQFMGDILSSVEYVAHANRERIDRWGFWGLILFVWIPFMASGVLVGAMLGLVARMSFPRVLLACSVGGAAASITWAYTAEGIINILHALKADLLIPIIIFVIFMLAVLHIRTNKRRRQEMLFQESLEFFGGDHDDPEQA